MKPTNPAPEPKSRKPQPAKECPCGPGCLCSPCECGPGCRCGEPESAK